MLKQVELEGGAVRKRLVLYVWISGAASLALSGTSLAADTVIATVPHQTPVAAYDGHVVWSVPSPGGYQLVEYQGGRVQTLPIAPRIEPFDVDLGPDRRGRPVAVYSRCRTPRTDFRSLLSGRRGCDLYLYDFVTRTEHVLAGANGSGDEFSPAIWRKRIAFVRTHARRGERTRTDLYLRRLSKRGRSRRLRDRLYATSVDMRGRRVVFIDVGEFGGGQVQLAYTNGGGRLLGSVPGSGAAAFEYDMLGISATAGFTYWLVTRPAEAGLPALGEIRRRHFAAGREQRATVAIDESADAFAQDGEVSYYALPASGEACVFTCAVPHDIHRLDGVGFERALPLPLDSGGG
jgi:hypothetical protein